MFFGECMSATVFLSWLGKMSIGESLERKNAITTEMPGETGLDTLGGSNKRNAEIVFFCKMDPRTTSKEIQTGNK